MKIKRSQIVAVTTLLMATGAASALTMGRTRGAAILGRPLDITVLASVDAQESTPELNCFAAEVLYGDTKISSGQIGLSVERFNPQEVRIRVRSATPIDEPVATLILRSSCNGNSSRRYVLLADVLNETDNSALSNVPFVVRGATSPAVAAANAARQAAQPDAKFGQTQPETEQILSQDKAQAARDKRRAERQERLANKEPSVVSLAAKPSTFAPRLKVDLLDLEALAATTPGLRSTKELMSAPTTDENLRAQAFALWSTINAPAEDAMRNTQRLQTLELQLKQSQELSKRQSQDIARLDSELAVAKRERFLNPLTIGLALLAAAALAAAAWMSRRQSTSTGQPWWRGAAKTEKDEAELWAHLDANPAQQKTSGFPVVQKRTLPSGNKMATATGGSVTAAGHAALAAALDPLQNDSKDPDSLDFDLGKSRPPANFRAAKSLPLSSGVRGNDFSGSDFGAASIHSRTANAEELFDIQEQADFFLSLGQPDQAIEVLTSHISDNVETSALAYMDLFDIYHRVGRRAEYDQLREEFNRVFNAQVPEFDQYNTNSRGLEGYPVALKSIQEVWPTSAVLGLIEESIFRKPDASDKPFDMQAYRELMSLYSLAKEMADSNFSPLSAGNVAPLSTATSTEMGALQPLREDFASFNTPLLDDDVGLKFSLDAQDALNADSTMQLSSAQAAQQTLNPPAKDDNSLDFDLSDFGGKMTEEDAQEELDRQLRAQLERQLNKK